MQRSGFSCRRLGPGVGLEPLVLCSRTLTKRSLKVPSPLLEQQNGEIKHDSTLMFRLTGVAHVLGRRLLAGLGRCGLAAAEREVVMAGGKAVEVVRMRITAVGRRALKAMLPEM
jgi:hypothetical protein